MFFLDSEHVGMAGNISNGFRKIEVYNSPLKFSFLLGCENWGL